MFDFCGIERITGRIIHARGENIPRRTKVDLLSHKETGSYSPRFSQDFLSRHGKTFSFLFPQSALFPFSPQLSFFCFPGKISPRNSLFLLFSPDLSLLLFFPKGNRKRLKIKWNEKNRRRGPISSLLSSSPSTFEGMAAGGKGEKEGERPMGTPRPLNKKGGGGGAPHRIYSTYTYE